MRDSIELGTKKLDLAEYRMQLGHRINSVVKKYGKKKSAAFVAGVSVEQLNKWIYAQVKVPTEGLYALATGCGMNFYWLVSGEGSPFLHVGDPDYDIEDNIYYPEFKSPVKETIDPEILTSVLQSLIVIMQNEGLQMTSPERFSELVIALHDLVRKERKKNETSEVNIEAMAQIIRLAAK